MEKNIHIAYLNKNSSEVYDLPGYYGDDSHVRSPFRGKNLDSRDCSVYAGSTTLCPGRLNLLSAVDVDPNVFKDDYHYNWFGEYGSNDTLYLNYNNSEESKITMEFSEELFSIPDGQAQEAPYLVLDDQFISDGRYFNDSVVFGKSFIIDLNNAIIRGITKIEIPNMEKCRVYIGLPLTPDNPSFPSNVKPLEIILGKNNSIYFTDEIGDYVKPTDLYRPCHFSEWEDDNSIFDVMLETLDKLTIQAPNSKVELPCWFEWVRMSYPNSKADQEVTTNDRVHGFWHSFILHIYDNCHYKFNSKNNVYTIQGNEVSLDINNPGYGNFDSSELDSDRINIDIIADKFMTSSLYTTVRSLECKELEISGRSSRAFKFKKLIAKEDELSIINSTGWKVQVGEIYFDDIELASGNKKLTLNIGRGIKVNYKGKVYTGKVNIFLN